MASLQLAFDFNAPLDTLPQLWTPDDIYDALNEETVQRFREDSRIERKRASVTQRDLADNLSMWANTQPTGGIIFVGVENDGSISGCASIEQEHINQIETVRRLCPDARFDIKKVKCKNRNGDEDFIIAMRVHYRDDKLVETADHNAFVREGDQKRKLTEAEKREVRLNKGELDVESERITALDFPADYDSLLLEQFRINYVTKRKLRQDYTLEDVLRLTKLGKRGRAGFEPNLACALLFAKDPRVVAPGAYIRVIRYDGVEEKFGGTLNNVNDRLFEGPLSQQIAEADKFIASQIRNFTRLGVDGKFATNPEYPRPVWLEALVNAAVHRSYNLKHMNIFVKMFEDKMIIESPGAFMPPTTAETVYEAHNPRNPNLMWALFYFNYVQCAFEHRRMRQDMRAANLPDPKFAQKQIGTFQVSVTLENDHEHRRQYVRSEAAESINPEIYATLTEREKMIVNYLADQDTINVTDAGLVIGKGWRPAKKVLDSLHKKKIIARSAGKARSSHRFYYLRKDKLGMGAPQGAAKD
ncbi:hypothetical protein CTI14_01640 [Methylobacterium radiotolerans]|nr:hypothetical protein CTI14_01640 [Methylobacterium radiotolerans]